jgi:hypothetical protein
MGSYRERLTVPASYWALAVLVAPSLGAEAYFFVDGVIPPLVILAVFAAMAAFMLKWSSATVEVSGTTLRAGKDTLDLSEADEVIALDERQTKLLSGPKADPAAFLLLRPYLKRAVCVSLTDRAADAGVPYWLVTTRHPEALAAAIEGAKDSLQLPVE